MLFPIEYIFLLNIALLLLFVLFVLSGWKQGFLLKVLSCIGMIVVGFVSWFLSSPLGKLFHIVPADMTPMEDTIFGPVFYETINRMAVFVVLFFLLSIVILCLKPIMKAIGSLPVVRSLNAVLGAVFGGLEALIVMMIITFMFTTPLFANGKRVIQDSYLKPFNEVTNKVLFFASDTLSELQVIQKIVTPSTALSQEDITILREWLLDHDLPENQVEDFLRELQGV